MLPFLKKKDTPAAGLIIKTRTPDEPAESEDDSSAAIESCAHALINAVHARDAKSVAAAMKDAFDILESQPHEEYSSKHDYDSQNQKAAEEQE